MGIHADVLTRCTIVVLHESGETVVNRCIPHIAEICTCSYQVIRYPTHRHSIQRARPCQVRRIQHVAKISFIGTLGMMLAVAIALVKLLMTLPSRDREHMQGRFRFCMQGFNIVLGQALQS